MLIPLSEDRDRIKRFKDGWTPNSCTPRGLFEYCKTAQEQCDIGEKIAAGILSLYPRYMQHISTTASGCPYDLTVTMVSLNMIAGIQVRTTGTDSVRLTSNNNNPGAYIAYKPDYSVQHAIFVVHADYMYYFIPTKEIFKDPIIKGKLDKDDNKEVKFKITDYDKFKLHFDYMFVGPLPEILKYQDYWI